MERVKWLIQTVTSTLVRTLSIASPVEEKKYFIKCVSYIITQFNSFNLSLVIQGDWVDGNRSGKGLYLYSETGNRYKGIAGIYIFIEHVEI